MRVVYGGRGTGLWQPAEASDCARWKRVNMGKPAQGVCCGQTVLTAFSSVWAALAKFHYVFSYLFPTFHECPINVVNWTFKNLRLSVNFWKIKPEGVPQERESSGFYHSRSIFSLVKYLQAFKMPCTVLRLVYSITKIESPCLHRVSVLVEKGR